MTQSRYFKATFADGTTICRGSPIHVYAKASRYQRYYGFHRSLEADVFPHCLEVVRCVEIDAKEAQAIRAKK